ncbi:unnamed protein product, partial [Prorocentrum cordatum]
MTKLIQAKHRPAEVPDRAVTWPALAWFSPMRVGECVWSSGSGRDKVLTGGDVAARCGGCPTTTADQPPAGEERNQCRTGECLCPALVAEWAQQHFSERFATEKHLPLCCQRNGTPAMREEVQKVLEQRIRPHLPRIGGAAALYHIYPDVELIKNLGRQSSTFWGASEGAKVAAAGPAGAARGTTSLHADSRPPKAERPRAQGAEARR